MVDAVPASSRSTSGCCRSSAGPEASGARIRTVTETSHRWYARPVFYVADIEGAIRFYVDSLGFEKAWHEADGKGTVCQVNRSDCEIILCQDATRRDKARLFVELRADGLAAFRQELADRSVPHRMSWWGYDVVQVDDPDGNELLFPIPE